MSVKLLTYSRTDNKVREVNFLNYYKNLNWHNHEASVINKSSAVESLESSVIESIVRSRMLQAYRSSLSLHRHFSPRKGWNSIIKPNSKVFRNKGLYKKRVKNSIRFCYPTKFVCSPQQLRDPRDPV